MENMILIASASYVDRDLSDEVGLLPPAFLPVGNRRLVSYQLDILKNVQGEIYLSIPESFTVDEFDRELLSRGRVTILRVPDNLSLGRAVLYCWNATGKSYSRMSILYGDTLILNIDLEECDVVSIAPRAGLNQGVASKSRARMVGDFLSVYSDEEEMVVSGYFCLSAPQLLMKGLIESDGDFIEGLRSYAASHSVRGVRSGQSLNFGHINSFFRSRTVITTQRAFNDMSISSRTVVKTSSNIKKMIGEAEWFDRIPSALRIHTPALLGKPNENSQGAASYELEYLYLPPLSDLFVYGSLSNDDVSDILHAAKAVLDDFSQFRPGNKIDYSVIDRIYLAKTLERLKSFSHQHNFDLNKKFLACGGGVSPISIMQMALDSARFISPVSRDHIAVSHGDFCFSNILFDRKSKSIKVIDPRGMDEEGNPTIYGDRRYDIAKLYHSTVGLYDFLVAGRYELIKSGDGCFLEIIFPSPEKIESAERIFSEIFFKDCGFCEKEILAITVHLFLSMLPLHYDRPDRQDAMIANALRLFRRLVVASRPV